MKGIAWKGKYYPFTPQILILTHQQQTAFENIVGKEEIARYEQFLLFPQCFLLNQKSVSLFVNIFDIISLFAAELKETKFGMWGKGLSVWNKLNVIAFYHNVLQSSMDLLVEMLWVRFRQSAERGVAGEYTGYNNCFKKIRVSYRSILISRNNLVKGALG